MCEHNYTFYIQKSSLEILQMSLRIGLVWQIMIYPSHGVLVYLSCLREYHRLVYEKQIYFNKFEDWAVQNQGTGRFWVWWEPASWFLDSCLLSGSSHSRRDKGPLWGSLSQRHLSHSSFHPHYLTTSQRPHIQISSHWGLGLSMWIFGGSYSAPLKRETALSVFIPKRAGYLNIIKVSKIIYNVSLLYDK